MFAPDIADEIDDILPSDDIPGDNGSPEPSGSGGNTEHTATPPVEEPTASPSPTPVVYGQNVMEIDFDALIANESDSTLLDMHNYFSSVEPTYKNVYTGMFEGKNLIWLVGEAFSSYAVDKDLTPTLYKLANEGFVFTNFYNPVWGVSTSDGEYVPMTGLIPKSGVWSFAMSGENYMPFGMGNMLKKSGTRPAPQPHLYVL